MSDQIFNQLADRFCDRIYGKSKGRIRIQRLWLSMLQELPLQQTPFKPLDILDVGGGAGHIALWLCELGHKVTLVEPAQEMVELAEQQLSPFIATGQAQVIQADLQSCDADQGALLGAKTYDVVLFHAVLEWLKQPEQAIPALARRLSPNGFLSLMFYNRNSLLIKNLLKGNFHRVNQALHEGQWGGDKGSLTPISPLDPQEVVEWIKSAGLSQQSLTGIRSFYDFMPRALQEQRSEEEVLALEVHLSGQEPFVSMARYIHLVARLSEC